MFHFAGELGSDRRELAAVESQIVQRAVVEPPQRVVGRRRLAPLLVAPVRLARRGADRLEYGADNLAKRERAVGTGREIQLVALLLAVRRPVERHRIDRRNVAEAVGPEAALRPGVE